jgi:hypothetical protein
MPSRRLPNTISAVIRTLTTARDAWKKYPDAPLISAEQFAKLDAASPQSLLSRTLKEAGDVPLALATQAPLTDASNKGLARLTLYVSHFHQIYDFGVARGVFTADGRAYYDRDVGTAILPDLTSATAVLEAAAKIAPGEAKRQAAEGTKYVAMALPSATEVAAVHAEVADLQSKSQVAQAFTALQHNELAAIYPDAQKLAVAICNTVEYHLENDEAYAHLDAPARRRLARLWGVVYIYDQSETPDEGDTNAANTTLPGPTTAAPTSTPAQQ